MLDYYTLFIGSSCNNDCSSCQYKNTEKSLRPFEEIEEEIKTVKNKDNLALVGGEPTLREDLLNIAKTAKESGFKRIKMVTNGRVLADSNVTQEILGAKVYHFDVKLLGSNPQMHDYQTESRGSFKETIEGITNLKRFQIAKSNQTPYVQIRIGINCYNVQHLSQIAQSVLPFYIDRIVFDFIDSEVPFKDAFRPIFNSINTGIFGTVWAETEKIPLCMLEGLEEHASELRTGPSYKSKQVEVCETCLLKKYCPGIASDFLEKKSQELKPVKDKELAKKLEECEHLWQKQASY